MKVKDIFKTRLIKTDTRIWIRETRWRNGECMGCWNLAEGYMKQDCIQKYKEREVGCFAWQDDKRFYIDLRE